MHTQIAGNAAIDPLYVWTGHSPPQELVKALVVEAYDRFKSNIEGQNSQVDPALAEAPRLMCPRNRIGASENVA
jgi:glutaminase